MIEFVLCGLYVSDTVIQVAEARAPVIQYERKRSVGQLHCRGIARGSGPETATASSDSNQHMHMHRADWRSAHI